MRISTLPSLFAICRLEPDAAWPEWARGAFVSMTRTSEELSIVCADDAVPEGVRVERAWRALKADGPIPFETTGVAAALVGPLAEAKISVVLVATFDTDYVLVKSETFERACEVLRATGHDVS